jgi:hypothetical protein
MRTLLFVHRWLGVIVGLMMTLWCLSGFVMMYSGYPRLDNEEQLRGLEALHMPAPAAWSRTGLAGDLALSGARIEMMAGAPVLRVTPAGPPLPRIAQMRASPNNIDLATGQPIAAPTADEALAVGRSFGTHFGISGSPVAAVPVGIDQWNVQTFRRHAPLHRIDYPDAETVYVAASGEVVQQTTRAERFWGWLGAVPHWLYPTLLRQDGKLWNDVVVWVSLVGVFLTATGLYVGISRLRRGRDGKLGSPYRGIWWLHHMTGLFFGVLTLTWVTSGLFTMNPWGLLDSMAGFEERSRLSGPALQWAPVSSALATFASLPAGTVRIETAPLGGRLYFAVIGRDGSRTRLDAAGHIAPLSRDEVARALANGPPVKALDLLRQEDAYYYSHQNKVTLPVWRAALDDKAGTTLYIDTRTGRLLRAVDETGRWSRWLRTGLHDLDLPWLRMRPVWDLVVLPLLALVTLVCATGTWMAYGKVKKDVKRVRNRRRRRRAALVAARESASTL